MAAAKRRGIVADYGLLWALPLIRRGFWGVLEEADVAELPVGLDTATVLARVEAAWRKEQLLRGPRARLGWALWPVCRRDFCIGCAFGAANGLLNTVARPLLLRALLAALARDAGAEVLWMFAGLLCAVLLLEGYTCVLSRHSFVNRLSTLFVSGFCSLAHVHSLDVATSTTHGAADVGNLVGNDAMRVAAFMFSFSLFPGACVQMVGGIIILVYTIGLSGICGLAFMMLMLSLNSYFATKAKAAEKENLARTDSRMGIVSQIIHGIRAIKFCAWETEFLNVVTDARASECIPLMRYRVLNQGAVQIGRANPMVGCVFALVFLALSARADPDSFLPSDIFSALNVFLSLRTSLIIIPESFIYIAAMNVSLRRLQDLLNIPPASCHQRHRSDHRDVCVQVKGATFTWPDSTAPAIASNLTIMRGSMTAIVGSVGSGKSSMLGALLGEIPLAHLADEAASVDIFSDGLAYVPQKAFVLSGTVVENVAFGCAATDTAQLNAAIEAAALSVDLDSLPRGELTEVGERGVVLSGGQQQRLAIARAFYGGEVDLIIADDPLSALDPAVASDVFASLKRFVSEGEGKRTCIVVLNQLWLLPHFDDVLVMKGGSVLEQGSPRTLLSTRTALAEFCESSGCDVESLSKSATTLVTASSSLAGTMKSYPPVEANKISVDDVLVVSEEKLAGAMPLAIMRRYVQGMGYWWFALCNFIALSAYCTMGFTDYWLATWVSAREGHRKDGVIVDDDMYIAVYGSGAALFLVLLWTTSYCFARGGVRSSRHLHRECMSNLLKAPVAFFEATPSGRILSRFSNDLAIVDLEIPRWVDNVWQICITSFVLGAQVAVVVPIMTPVLLVAYSLYIYQIGIVNKANRELRRWANTKMGPVLTTVNECVSGRHVVRSMGRGPFFRDQFNRQFDEYIRFSMAATACVNCGTGFAYFISFVISMTVAGITISDRSSYELSFVALALTYSFVLPYFLNVMSQIIQLLLNSLTSLERLLQYGDGGIIPAEPPWTTPKGHAEPSESWPSEGRIEFREVTLVYRPGLPKAVDCISFCFAPGEKVGVVGRSGSGKSSILVLLLRLNEASGGRILIDNVDIAHVGLGRLRRAIAVVPQDPLLITGNVRSNLDPFNEHPDSRLAEILGEVELDPGLLESNASALILSQGERQLLTLGRTLLWPARMRIFDEPTSNIDAATDVIIQRLVRSAVAFAHSTQVTIAHRLGTVMDCDRILVMETGRIAELGPPRQLLADPASKLATLANHAGRFAAAA